MSAVAAWNWWMVRLFEIFNAWAGFAHMCHIGKFPDLYPKKIITAEQWEKHWEDHHRNGTAADYWRARNAS